MKKLITRLVLSAGLAGGLVAQAAAAPCTLAAAGQQCVLQWDLSALQGNLDVERILFSPSTGQATFAWFDGLNGTGAAGPSGGPGSLFDAFMPLAPNLSIFDDGRFSVVFTATSASFSMGEVSFYLTNGTQTSSAAGAAGTPPAAVPAPESWTLALAGLAAIAATRRRR